MGSWVTRVPWACLGTSAERDQSVQTDSPGLLARRVVVVLRVLRADWVMRGLLVSVVVLAVPDSVGHLDLRAMTSITRSLDQPSSQLGSEETKDLYTRHSKECSCSTARTPA